MSWVFPSRIVFDHNKIPRFSHFFLQSAIRVVAPTTRVFRPFFHQKKPSRVRFKVYSSMYALYIITFTSHKVKCVVTGNVTQTHMLLLARLFTPQYCSAFIRMQMKRAEKNIEWCMEVLFRASQDEILYYLCHVLHMWRMWREYE